MAAAGVASRAVPPYHLDVDERIPVFEGGVALAGLLHTRTVGAVVVLHARDRMRLNHAVKMTCVACARLQRDYGQQLVVVPALSRDGAVVDLRVMLRKPRLIAALAGRVAHRD